MTLILVATESTVVTIDADRGTVVPGKGLGDRPTCLAADPFVHGRAWCGTHTGGVFRTDDAGASWRAVGLERKHIMSIAASPAERDLIWVGTEPSEVWRSESGGDAWHETHPLETLPSTPEWSFPPKPDTHHVRWIACHPRDAQQLWIAIEAGALVSTRDGGRTWHDRVTSGPWDTHELAIHPDAPNSLRVAAGDGYFESDDSGATWRSPEDGLEVGYLRSVTIDPGNRDVVIIFDGSYSMGFTSNGSSAHERAKEWAQQFLNDIAPGDSVSILQAKQQVIPVLGKLTTDPDRSLCCEGI